MKVEMGESLMYSWLCHVKGCQIVQTNWKASSAWPQQDSDRLPTLFAAAQERFAIKTVLPEQFIKQAEVDVMGIAIVNGRTLIYAADVAFHEGGLIYGEDTAGRVMMKYIRTALCLYRYFSGMPGEILFASPKINPADMKRLLPRLEDVRAFFQDQGLPYTVTLAANEEFARTILDPVLSKSKQVADTSELFMRSYQLLQMFKK